MTSNSFDLNLSSVSIYTPCLKSPNKKTKQETRPSFVAITIINRFQTFKITTLLLIFCFAHVNAAKENAFIQKKQEGSYEPLSANRFNLLHANNQNSNFSQDQDEDYNMPHQRFLSSTPATSNEVLVNQYILGDQMSPFVACLTDDRFIVTWQSAGQDGSGFGIFARFYDANAPSFDGEFQVNNYTLGDQSESVVAGLIDGSFIISWVSSGQDTNGNGVFAQRFYANGTRYGLEFQVNEYTASDQDECSVTGLHDGGYVITWESSGQDGSGYGVYAKIYNQNNTVRKAEFLVPTLTDADQIVPV